MERERGRMKGGETEHDASPLYSELWATVNSTGRLRLPQTGK